MHNFDGMFELFANFTCDTKRKLLEQDVQELSMYKNLVLLILYTIIIVARQIAMRFISITQKPLGELTCNFVYPYLKVLEILLC